MIFTYRLNPFGLQTVLPVRNETASWGTQTQAVRDVEGPHWALCWEGGWLFSENIPKQVGCWWKTPFQNYSLVPSTYLERPVIWFQLQRWVCHCWRTQWFWGLQKPPEPSRALCLHIFPLCSYPSLAPNNYQQQRRFGDTLKTPTQWNSQFLLSFIPCKCPWPMAIMFLVYKDDSSR